METTHDNLQEVTVTSKRLVTRLATTVENRLELLTVELHEERARILRSLGLILGVAVLGFLAGVAMTVAVVLFFWEHSPAVAALGLAALYGGGGAWLYFGFIRLQRDWRTLPDTIEQLRRDCECLQRNLN